MLLLDLLAIPNCMHAQTAQSMMQHDTYRQPQLMGAAPFTGFPNKAPPQGHSTAGRLVPYGVGLFAIHLHGRPFLQSSSPPSPTFTKLSLESSSQELMFSMIMPSSSAPRIRQSQRSSTPLLKDLGCICHCSLCSYH